MTAARLIFAVAAVYGIAVLLPGLFVETGAAPLYPPLAQPEFYYGFYGSALVWQLLFIAIALDPARYRPLMLVAMLEKAAFFIPCLWLWQTQRLPAVSGPFIGAMVDGLLMLAFLLAWRLTRTEPPTTALPD